MAPNSSDFIAMVLISFVISTQDMVYGDDESNIFKYVLVLFNIEPTKYCLFYFIQN